MNDGKPVYHNVHHDIIDNCRKGDRKAQFQLYRLYYRNMYNLSLRILDDSGEAEDIMQEAFLAAFDNLDSYGEQVSFGAWLKRIVINRSIDAVKKRRIDFVSLEEGADLPDPADEGSDDEQARWQTEEIHRCIRLLPDGYRIILSLYLLEGYDHEEIAEILNISASTSRSQYTRAKKRLAGMLNKER